MTREELFKLMEYVASPFSPFENVDYTEKQAYRNTLLANASKQDIERLLDILVTTPIESVHPEAQDDWEFEIKEALVTLGERDPQAMLNTIEPLLVHTRGRVALMQVIGALHEREGVRLLAPLVPQVHSLTEEEQVCLAASLGDVGGREAKRLLEEMRGMVSSEVVDKEIGIALAAIEQYRPL
jgi:hypothetical protein